MKGLLLFTIVKGTLMVYLLAGLLFTAEAQTVECITKSPTEKELIETEKRVASLRQRRAGARIQANAYTFVPLRFHVLRRGDGSGGATTAQINEALSKLNDHYRVSGIQFYLAGNTPHVILSDDYYDFEPAEEEALTGGNDLTNAVNIYLVGTLNYQSSSATGYAYYPSVLAMTNRVFVRVDRLTDQRTLAHELGHYFNLLHTFHNNANSDVSLRELVTRGSGANCTTAGDLLCDTPADPYGLPNTTTLGCSYSGTATDANGQVYTPSLVNMMSYYYSCGNEFTAGQSERMEGGLLLRTSSQNQYTLDYPGITAVPSQLVANQIAEGVQISFADIGSSEGGYVIERATSQEGPFVPIKGLDVNVTTYLDVSVTSNTLYYYRVRASNSTTYSAIDTAQVHINYCKPTYNSPGSPMIIADFFLSQNGQNLIAKTNSGSGTNSYSDFTTTVGEVVAGQSYTMMARAVAGGVGTYYPQHLSLWIDLDQNGFFEPTELLFQTSSSTYMAPTVQGTITIPQQAVSGPTRMRLRTQYYVYGVVTNPCGQLNFGEAEDYTLNITNTSSPAIETTSINVTSACPNDSLQVFYTASGTFNAGNTIVVQLARGTGEFFSIPTTGTSSPLKALLPDTLTPAGNYRVRVVASNPVVSGTTAPQTLLINPRLQVVLSGDATVAAGDSATLTVSRVSGVTSWEFGLSNGLAYQAGTVSAYTVRVAPSTTTTYTIASAQDQGCGVGTGSGTATVTVTAPAPVTVQVRVFLEGPYRTATGQMITVLNQRGLLPGQTPIGSTAITTPAGQPYAGNPWNYAGTETVSNYPTNVVDWILISFRKDSPSVNNTVFKAAALLAKDGWITLLNPPTLAGNSSYYIVIEHRNHLGVMSHIPVSVENNTLSYDFTTQNTYTATSPVSIGQKQIGTVFALHASDGNKNLPNQDFVINVNDYVLWSGVNGRFDLYSPADFNLDAQISASDLVLWNSNNSKFSLVGRQ